MSATSNRRILVVEDKEDWRETIVQAIEKVLHDLGREVDYTVMCADDERQALELLKRHTFTLVSMDINLSDVTEGTSEGLGLLEYLEGLTSDTWSIIVSGADKYEYMQDAFEKYNILRFLEKGRWPAGEHQQLKTAVKSILLYTDPLIYLEVGDWKQASDGWKKACEFAPELKKRFKYVDVLIEKAKLEVTGLPTGEMVDSQLRALLREKEPWGILYIKVNNLEEYYAKYGHIEGDSALQTVTRFLRDQVAQASFIGYPDRGLFMVIVEDRPCAQSLSTRLLDSFWDVYSNLYPYQDLDENRMVRAGIPELRLAIRMVSNQDGPFADIREISRMGSGSGESL